MTINHFFGLIAMILAGTYLFFKPDVIKTPDYREIAQLDLKNFTLYEMDRSGLTRKLQGKQGRRFSDRYEVTGVTFVDTTGTLRKEMESGAGRSTADTLTLYDGVLIRRSDGSVVRADTVTYDKAHKQITGNDGFDIVYGPHRFSGTNLRYDMEHGILKADNIAATYRLDAQGDPL
jgi:hypothetical protein